MTNQSELDIKDTHKLIDVPVFGKVWVIMDMAQYYRQLEAYITANYTPNSEVERQVQEAIGGHVRETYYNYDCPNNLHLFALLGDTETCVYCYVKDNPPTKGVTR